MHHQAFGLNPEALAQMDLGMFLLDGKEVEPNVLEFDRVGQVKSFKMKLEPKWTTKG